MKQTAVDWLIDEIKFARNLCDDPSVEMDIWHTLDVLISKGQEAKEMEKEQMLKTFTESRVISVECAVWNCEGDRRKWESFEQYYNETFNTNEK